jgi:hypothetical protein
MFLRVRFIGFPGLRKGINGEDGAWFHYGVEMVPIKTGR